MHTSPKVIDDRVTCETEALRELHMFQAYKFCLRRHHGPFKPYSKEELYNG